MVVLAALPGMVKQLLVTEKIVSPGNFGATVNFLGFHLRNAGLGWCPGTPKASSFSSRIRVVGNVVGGLINGSSESADFGQIGGADAIIGPGTNVSHADTEQGLMNQFGGQIDGE